MIRKKIPILEQRIADTREQEDEPGEVAALEKQLQDIRDEMKRLKES